MNINLVNQWLSSPIISQNEKDMIEIMNDKEIEDCFQSNKLKFGTAGIRSLTGLGTSRLNIYTYRALTLGVVQWIKETCHKSTIKIVIFRDTRLNGDKYVEAISQVLHYYGIEVWLIKNNNPCSTPLISYLLHNYDFDAGINITASHNPKEWNGFKVFNHNGVQVSADDAQKISNYIPQSDEILSVNFSENTTYKYIDENLVYEVYFSKIRDVLPITDLSNEDKNFGCYYSAHHGVSVRWMKKLANKLGYKHFKEYKPECIQTGNFPDNEILNPEVQSSFDDMNNAALLENIKYTIASDPDADRYSFSEFQKDNTWYTFNGNEQGILLANYLLTTNPEQYKNSFIVSTYVTGNFIEKLLHKNIEVHRTGTGFKLICAKIDSILKQDPKKKLLIAYEEAIGAMFFDFIREKCSFQCIALTLDMIAFYKKQGKLITDVLHDLYEKHGYWIGRTDSFVLPLNTWDTKIHELLNQSESHRLIDRFGYQIHAITYNEINQSYDWLMNDSSWIRFRASGTEPKFKIYYNLYADSKESAEKAYKNWREYLMEYFKLK